MLNEDFFFFMKLTFNLKSFFFNESNELTSSFLRKYKNEVTF